jgi:hypothetical protein
MYHHAISHMSKLLGQVDHWLDVAVAHAEAKKFDPTLYLGFRLAPDQLALARQLQIACDTVKLGSARLAGKDAPTHADDEKTVDDLRARLKSTRAFVDGLAVKDFEHAATRVISQPRWEGKVMTGQNYFYEHVTPNFFFHLSHTYAILRHNGVPLGKKDYLGALTQTPG